MLCPYHLAPLIKVGEIWVCPVGDCSYVRLACPLCGGIIRIAPPTPFCLDCGAPYTLKEVALIISQALKIPESSSERIVLSIYSHYTT